MPFKSPTHSINSPGKRHKAAIDKSLRYRATAHQRGYTAKWRKARLNWLQEHPLCAAHESRGQIVAATVVDHIEPHRGDQQLFWDTRNWQSLCEQCHGHKSGQEQQKARRAIKADGRYITTKDDLNG